MLEWDILNYLKKWRTNLRATANDIIKIKTGDINIIIGTINWQNITYGNGRYVAVGRSGYIAYFIDEMNWTSKQVSSNCA